ncbi:hypothetical protein LCGC14_0873020 [marine sediment metagenome]|uniref:Uncharacterized protein n=1 Tax=marine sediment metagenome TaxID=412755 RepID=A0A0F9P925_9ZZZZ
MTITFNKDKAYIEITEDGVTYRRAIVLEDGVVSLVDPDGTNKKVDLVYVNASDQLVLVLEDDSEVTVAAGSGDMLKSVYDTGNSGVVDDAEDSQLLEGSTKAQVQDHTPKAHTLGSHSTRAHSELSDAPTDAHHTKYTDAEAVVATLPLILALGG